MFSGLLVEPFWSPVGIAGTSSTMTVRSFAKESTRIASLAPAEVAPIIQVRSVASSPFKERLHAAARANDSWLCVGLDPDPSLLPDGVAVHDFLRGIVD